MLVTRAAGWVYTVEMLGRGIGLVSRKSGRGSSARRDSKTNGYKVMI